jgi:membrane protein
MMVHMGKTKFTAKPKAGLFNNLRKVVTQSSLSYDERRYSTPLFVAHETFNAFQRHNVLGLSAALSFYAMFALIPMVLLMFFLMSQLVFSSEYAIVKLAIITGNLVPKLSSTIMVEVYKTAQQKAAWGALGLFILLWAVTPLASAIRSTFYNIANLVEARSFIKRKVKDILAVVAMLLLFFLFTLSGLMLEQVIAFVTNDHKLLHSILGVSDTGDVIASMLFSLILTTLTIAVFYVMFFPVRLYFKHIFIGALFTAIIWLLMRPAFSWFLSANESYGAVFGSMKNLFLSITWLYFNFTAFLLGTELIATLRKRDVLLLKSLFIHMSKQASKPPSPYIQKLMHHYGKTYQHAEHIFSLGDTTHNLYYLVRGQVKLLQHENVLRTVEAGEYFGEIALLSNSPTIGDAVVSSDDADIVLISAENIETLLLDEPKVALRFLRQMATKLQKRDY